MYFKYEQEKTRKPASTTMLLVSLPLLLFPFFAFAQDGLKGFLKTIYNIFSALIAGLITLALLTFIWGVIRFIGAGDDAKAKETGKELMMWGIVALFVMISVWGLVAVLLATFGITEVSIPIRIEFR